MTREEAIDCLKGLKIYLKTEHIDEEAIDMAIEALSAPTGGDLISRADAIKTLNKIGSVDTYADREYAKEIFMQIPSTQPKRGEWIYDAEAYPLGNPHGHYDCDQCGESVPSRTNFCPNCGADMRGGEDEWQGNFE